MEHFLHVAEGMDYTLDSFKSGLNNNMLVVGASGSGKTRSIVMPNLLEMSGSYIVSDPKGNLYDKYGRFLDRNGYRVIRLDFTNPETSNVSYNPISYVRTQQDIIKIANTLQYAQNINTHGAWDPFWDKMGEILFQAAIGYMVECLPEKERNFPTLLKVIDLFQREGEGWSGSGHSTFEKIIERAEARGRKDYFFVRQYRRLNSAADKTYASVLATAYAQVARYESEELQKLMSENTVHVERFGHEKTACFVVVSDTDRSMDTLANIFFSQALNELCHVADTKCENQRLPIPVTFMLDDFATNVKIDEFPRMISSFRSRNISSVLMLQSEAQLRHCYGDDGETVMGNCDTYVYLGSNDLETAKSVAQRCDRPYMDILSMNVGDCWVFRRGAYPAQGHLINHDDYIDRILAPVRGED